MGESLLSNNKKFTLTIDKNHDIVLLDPKGRVRWSLNTSQDTTAKEQLLAHPYGTSFLYFDVHTKNLYLYLIPDGETFTDSVKGTDNITELWKLTDMTFDKKQQIRLEKEGTNTGGNTADTAVPSIIQISNDGNLIVKDSANKQIWSTELHEYNPSKISKYTEEEILDNTKCTEDVIFYDEANFKGFKTAFSTGLHNFNEKKPWQSIRIPKGCQVTVYKRKKRIISTIDDETTENQTYIYDKPDLNVPIYNMGKKISTISVQNIGKRVPEISKANIRKTVIGTLFMFVFYFIFIFCGIFSASVAFKNQILRTQIIPYIPVFIVRWFVIFVYFIFGIPLYLYFILFKV